MAVNRRDVIDHFVARASTYDQSSSWCTDDALGERVIKAAAPRPTDHVLDVACGTGLVSRAFKGRVERIVGVDITTEMSDQARAHLDHRVTAPAETLPFPEATFDIVVCRQGIQFMTLPDAAREMVRVVKPGGRVVLVNLCAYGPADSAEYFEILRLRNPVRRHFFHPDDLADLLREAGCDHVVLERYISAEDIDVWSDNGAIEEDRRERIREVYRTASQEFLDLHAVEIAPGRIVDHMLFAVATGTRL